MIRINLVPIDELENPYWYAPDIAVLLLISLVGFGSIEYYFHSIQSHIAETQEKIESLNASTAQLAPDLERFKTLDNDVKKLQVKLQALQKITVSKLERFTPLIVLEHIQNLKPQGVWYTDFIIKNSSNMEFNLKGMAFNNIMTAELLTSLRATGSTDPDTSDLRSQVYFDQLGLVEAIIAPSQGSASNAENSESFGPPPTSFEIKGIIKERTLEIQSMPSETLPNPQMTQNNFLNLTTPSHRPSKG